MTPTAPEHADGAVEPAYEVSVVVPVYNPGLLLAEQLRALRQQDFDGTWEIVIADNGTTDGSLDDLSELAGGPPVRVVDASGRQGPSHARNVGARGAAGRWLAFCDADDEAAPSWLRELYAAKDTGDVVAGVYDVRRVNPSRLWSMRGPREHWDGLPQGPCGFLPFANTGNMMVRRDLYLSLGGFDESLTSCEDVEFSWRAQLGGLVLSLAPDAVIGYRFRSTAADTYRQMLSYTGAEALLYRRYRAVGARRQSAATVVGRVWWVLSRSFYLLTDARRRFLWCAVAGSVIGRVRGSVRHRVVYL